MPSLLETQHGPAPYEGQDHVVVYLGDDNGYFLGRQTAELAAQTAHSFDELYDGAGMVNVIDCSAEPAKIPEVMRELKFIVDNTISFKNEPKDI